jgi:ATP-dependent DNA helicase PIF1
LLSSFISSDLPIIYAFNKKLFAKMQVKFNNGIDRIMLRNVWASDKIPGIGVAQVPLILAWALTIHKSQGMTLDAIEIDIGDNIFAAGQAYTALSRAQSLSSICIKSISKKSFITKDSVLEFYNSIIGV